MTDENKFQRVQWYGDEPQESDDDGPDGMSLQPRCAGLSAEDLELLTLAARALGARAEVVEGEQWVNLHFADGQVVYGWNSLEFSGDALELAVMLKITPHIDGNLTDAESTQGFCTEPHFENPIAATRRAITRAAAEIGKAMT